MLRLHLAITSVLALSTCVLGASVYGMGQDLTRMKTRWNEVAVESSAVIHVPTPFSQISSSPVVVDPVSRHTRRLTIGLRDWRPYQSGTFTRSLAPQEYAEPSFGRIVGGRPMREALQRHGLMRVVADLNCKNGSLKIHRIEAADGMFGQSGYTINLRPSGIVVAAPMALPSVKIVCSADILRMPRLDRHGTIESKSLA